MKLNEIENNNLEYKKIIPTDAKKYLKTICSFANSMGGKIIFGVDDKTLEVIGFSENQLDILINKLVNVISDSIYPQIIPNIYHEKYGDKFIIVCEVYHGNHTPYYIISLGKENGTYIRTVNSTRPADIDIIKELELAGQNMSFDELVYNNTQLNEQEINDFCSRLYNFAKEKAIENGNDINSIKKITINNLIAWRMVKVVDNKYYKSNAFSMLCDDNPFQFVKVQCARFKGLTRSTFIDKKEYTGSLYDQVEKSYKFVLNHINLGLEIRGLVNSTIFELPDRAIREIVTNAIVHRRLNANSSVQVSVFDDRVEITSPGALFEGLTIELIKSGRTTTRNSCILNAFTYLGLVENWGTGIQRAMDLCREYGINDPEFVDVGNGLRVNLYRPSYVLEQNTQNSDTVDNSFNDINLLKLKGIQLNVYNIIKDNMYLNALQIADKLNINRDSAENAIKALRRKELIEFIGENKNSGGYKVK